MSEKFSTLMKLHSRKNFQVCLLLIPVMLQSLPAFAGISPEQRQRWLDDAVDAYIYGVAPVEMYRTVQQMVVTGEHFVVTGAFNRYHHSPKLATAKDRWVVAPNNDTLYSNAWLDLSQGPVILRVPNTGERYYVLQLMDMYTNNFALLGTRTEGNGVQAYWVAGPDWTGEVPGGMREVRTPGNLVWVLGRLHIKGKEELEEVTRLQQQFGIEAATKWQFKLPLLFDPAEPCNFYRTLDAVLKMTPPAATDNPLLSRLARLGIGVETPFDPKSLKEWQLEAMIEAETIARQRIESHSRKYTPLANGWIYDGENVGRFATDYLSRAATALTGLGVLNVEEAFYPFVFVDSNGETLQGGRRYRLRFSAEEIPRAKYFWSLSAYRLPQWSLVENPLEQYSLGNAGSDLLYSEDGALDILLQARAPQKQSDNWVPITNQGEFSLVLRIYGPQADMWKNYKPPAVELLH